MILISNIPVQAAIVAPYEVAPKVIYFDFGGVIASPDSQAQLDYLVDNLGFPREAVQDSPYLRWMQLHLAEIEYLSEIARAHQIYLTPGALVGYREAKRNSVQAVPGMAELVQKLRQMNYEVNLITNIRGENLDLLEPFKDLFDHVVHCPKDPGMRQAAWEAEWAGHNLHPAQLLLIDDQEPNVGEAQQLGIQAIQFQNADTLIQELLKRGIAVKN